MIRVEVNPDVLRWARETAGLSIEEAAKKLQFRPSRNGSAESRLEALEDGVDQPSRSLLLKMSKQYRRSLLTFYQEAPPRKGDRGEDFRRLPEGYQPTEDGLVDALVRDIKTRQSIVLAALVDEDEATALPIVGAATSNDGIQRVGNAISEFLKIDLDTFRAQRTATEAFAYLRLKAEAAGIFILIVGDLGSHHTRISLEAFRGFALADPVAPFIVINDQDSRAAWSFTLMHEMVHICLGQTGISGGGVDFGNEQFCNDVASEILLPAADLPALGITDATELVEAVGRINDFAQSRNLSRSMVAYKLFRAGEIGREMWSSLRSEFHRQWLEFRETQRREARDHEGGPTYYVVRRHRVGRALVDLVSRLTYSGTLTSTKAAKVLGVKPRNVFELLQTKA